MAENKKSFVLYADLIHTTEHLTMEEKGVLFNHMLEYVNDMNPKLEDRLLLIAWKPIEMQLKRDLVRWEESRSKKSKNGKVGNLKRWYPKIYKQLEDGLIDLDEAIDIAERSQKSQGDRGGSHPIANIAVNDNVNVNVNKEVAKTPRFVFKKALLDYGFNEELVSDWLKVRKAKKAANTLTSFKAFIKQVESVRKDKNELLRVIVERNWSGFKADWLTSDFNPSGQPVQKRKYNGR